MNEMKEEATMPDDTDTRKELEKLKIDFAAMQAAQTGAQATQAATQAGQAATQAAAQAGLTATTAASNAGMMATMAAGSIGFIVGIFLGISISKS
jgi:hypothetical protein